MSIKAYKKMYPTKETPVEYRERQQRNTEKYKNYDIRLQKTRSKGSISCIILLSKTMKKKEVYRKKQNIIYNKNNKEVYKQKQNMISGKKIFYPLGLNIKRKELLIKL